MRSGSKRPITVGVLVVIVLGVAGLAYGWLGPGTTNTIRASYTFDVTNPDQVAGYVDYVFIAKVVEEVGRMDDSTLFRVELVESLADPVPMSLTVAQIGYSRGNNVWVLEDQPRLEVGGVYVIAASAPIANEAAYRSGALGVLGGPWGAIIATDASIERMRQAVAARVFPADLPSAIRDARRAAKAEWEALRPGFGRADIGANG